MKYYDRKIHGVQNITLNLTLILTLTLTLKPDLFIATPSIDHI